LLNDFFGKGTTKLLLLGSNPCALYNMVHKVIHKFEMLSKVSIKNVKQRKKFIPTKNK